MSDLRVVSKEEFRRKLAELIDHRAEVATELREWQRRNAIRLVSVAAQLYGDALDRLAMWNKIAAAVHSAYAKSGGHDADLFINEFLSSIKAEPSAAGRNSRLADVVTNVGNSTEEERMHFLRYLNDHVITVIVYARAEWDRYKADKKAGVDTSWWGAELEFEATEGGAA